ncbi:hypothetical protein V565_298360, partial [Rhizoctonia solani 123E]
MGLPLDGPSEDWISNCDPEDSASDISSIKEDNDLPETDEPRPASPGSNKFNHKAWARCTKAEHICELADQGPIGYWLDAEAGFPARLEEFGERRSSNWDVSHPLMSWKSLLLGSCHSTACTSGWGSLVPPPSPRNWGVPDEETSQWLVASKVHWDIPSLAQPDLGEPEWPKGREYPSAPAPPPSAIQQEANTQYSAVVDWLASSPATSPGPRTPSPAPSNKVVFAAPTQFKYFTGPAVKNH